jgi:hypothetical protein
VAFRSLLRHHENTITVSTGEPGKPRAHRRRHQKRGRGLSTRVRDWINIPTIIKGKQKSHGEATQHHIGEMKKGKKYKKYKTVREAVGAAVKRSRSFDK